MIPLFSPLRQNQALGKALPERLSRVVASGEYVQGREPEAFENALAKRLGYPACVGTSNGTDALVLALKSLELEGDSQVIVPAYGPIATANAVPWVGLKPVFADVDHRTGNVTPESVASVLTIHTRAIVVADLNGRQAPVREIRALADRYGIYVVEDGSQSLGVPSHGGRGAHLYTTSFHPHQGLGALGDGGAVLAFDKVLATRLRELSRQGGAMRDHFVRVGTTTGLDSLQAAVLSLKLGYLDPWLAHRRTIASWYYRHLLPAEARGKVILPPIPDPDTTHAWAVFPVRVPQDREGFIEFLKEKGVASQALYPKPLPQQPALRRFASGEYPGAERLAREALALPLYPELTTQEFASIIKTTLTWSPPA